MRTAPLLLLAGLAALLALATPARADTVRVPQDHDTIQAAVDAAQSGDTIRVSKGTWAGFTLAGKTGITIRGQSKPVLDGGGAAGAIVTIADASDVELAGFVIRDSAGRGVLVTGSTGITVRRCTIEQIGSDGVRAWGCSQVLVEKCTITDAGSGVDFSAESPSGPTDDSVVRKVRFERCGEGIDVAGDGNLVEKNRLLDIEGTAVSLDDGTTNATIARNRIVAPNTAVRLLGSGHVVEKNKVRGTSNEGIIVESAGCRIEKNLLIGVTDDAIDLEGDDNLVLRNRIRDTGDNGIEMGPAGTNPYPVTGNLIERNRIVASGGDGLFIAQTVSGNTLRRNRAAKSQGSDLHSLAAEEANVFDANSFKTVEFP